MTMMDYNDPNFETAMTDRCNLANGTRPTLDGFGIFSGNCLSPGICGASDEGFFWFGNRQQMLDFVRECLPWLAVGSYADEDDYEATQGRINEVLASCENCDCETLRTKLNVAVQDCWNIYWMGTLRELAESSHPFAIERRESYVEYHEIPVDPDQGDFRVDTENSETLESFIDYLTDGWA